MLFILERQGKSGGGGYTDGKVVDFDTLVNIEKCGIRKSDFYGHRLYIIRVAIAGKNLFTLKELSKEEFLKLFGTKIEDMDWILDYYPIEANVKYKYPLFKKEVYSLYGRQCDRETVEV